MATAERDRDRLLREIALLAARHMARDGQERAHAKHKAALAIAGAAGGPLPGDALVEAALRELQRTCDEDGQRARVEALRRCALHWMERLQDHAPHLVGPALDGTATGPAQIDLHLYTDDPKQLELDLLARGVDFRVGEPPRGLQHAHEVIGFYAADPAPDTGSIRVLLTVLDAVALRRAARRNRSAGEPGLHAVEAAGRASLPMLRRLLQDTAGTPPGGDAIG